MGEFSTPKHKLIDLLQKDGATIVKAVSGTTTHCLCGTKGKTDYGQVTGPGSKAYKDAKALKKRITWFDEEGILKHLEKNDLIEAKDERKRKREEFEEQAKKAAEEEAERSAKRLKTQTDELLQDVPRKWKDFDENLIKTLMNNKGSRPHGWVLRLYKGNLLRCAIEDGTGNSSWSIQPPSPATTEDEWRKNLYCEAKNGALPALPPDPIRQFCVQASVSCVGTNSYSKVGKKTSAINHMRFKDKKSGTALINLLPLSEWTIYSTKVDPKFAPAKDDLECATPTYGLFFVNNEEPDVILYMYSWTTSTDNLWLD